MPNHSLERTGDAAGIHNEVVLLGWGEMVAVGKPPAAQLKAVMFVNM
jgi:hypothetical protein